MIIVSRCLHYFSTSAKLTHSEDCGKLNDCAIRLPSKDDKWLSFRNHCRKERVPFIVYADLECALEYDAHFIIKEFATAYEGRVDLLLITKEKYFIQILNNAVFGKTMENVRDRVDVKLLIKWEGRYGAEAMISKQNFHSRSVFSENLIAIELRKLEMKFYKPIYVGMCILDISKTCLYEFYHEYMAPGFREKCKIMYTDIDNISKTYLYEFNHEYMIPLFRENSRSITFDDYTQCLHIEIEMKRQQSCIRSYLHDVYTVSETEIPLSPYDDKRYIVPDSTDTLPWGHYEILL
ncbi:hypothetical protein ALC57_11985 [Trachymyrmex cornetzi]|uniref:Uncharacterized protein n=1 Tax=Trachymyrmex cornetzi TaxID=471704 RepID=A0A151J1M6_9HYME|nr:hypothetical protein ALC57_11985 [Trachymyrmex cornetzi]